MPELSVVLVNYNDRWHLEPCLLSLEKSSQEIELEVIVVDNASTDSSVELITGKYPWVRLIQNSVNLGFAKANNQALAACHSDYVLFLNTDTIIYSHALFHLLQEIKSDPSIGAVGPALIRKKGYQVSFGRKVGFFSEILQKCFFNPYYSMTLKFHKRKKEVGWLSAACLLTRRKIIEELGGFDKNFFLYFEDIDLCVRMKEKGWKLVFVPQAKVFHDGGVTTGPLKLRSRLEYRKSQLYFYRKHNSRLSLFLLRIYLSLNLIFLRRFLKLKKSQDMLLLEEFSKSLKAKDL